MKQRSTSFVPVTISNKLMQSICTVTLPMLVTVVILFVHTGVFSQACVAPNTQITGFSYTGTTANSVTGISFTGTSVSGYLVCTNPNGYYEYPTNGTTYSVGSVYNAGGGTAFNQTVQEVGPATSGITAATNLNSNTKYYFNVYPYNNTACTGGPEYISVYTRTVGSATTCVGAVTNVSFTAVSSTSEQISWTAPPAGNVTYTYTIQYKLSSSGTWITAVSSYGSSNSSYTITGLSANSSYDIQVITNNGTCGSTTTNTSAFTTVQANSITTTVSPGTLCAGNSLQVSFTSTGTYNSGNIYTAQLSNASGSFISPVVIGTLNSTATGSLSINATIPAGTSTGSGYLIRVISANPSVTGSSSSAFTINALPAATISASGSTTFCQGGSVMLTASSGSTYFWSPGGATTPSISATSSGSYTVVVSNSGNCSATSSPISVTVNAVPAANITSGGSTTFCQGGSITLSASTANSYLWSPGGQVSQSINVTASGNYTVIASNGTNCSATSSPVAITVNPLPTASITAGGATTFCQGGSVTLTASSGAGYLWSPGGATTQTISASSSGSYSVIVSSNLSCTASSSTTVVTVNSLPGNTITPTGSTTFCQGGSVTLTAVTANTYNWSPGGQTTQSIVANTAGNYSVVAGNGTNCSVTSNQVSVVVNTLPSASITAGGPTTICQDNSVTLTASAGSSYLWSPGGATSQSITASASGSYSVIITNNNNCSATSSVTTVSVNQLPTAGITPQGSLTFCNGNSVTLTAAQAASYLWSPGGATTQSITANQTGSYTVVESNGANCSATSTAITVTVYTGPAPAVTASGPISFCQGDSVLLIANSATSYLWSPGGATTQNITANSSGSYSVTEQDNHQCSASSAPVAVTVNALPVATISAGGPTNFCGGDSVVITAGGGDSYTWSPGGATTSRIVTKASGSYSVLVGSGNCFSRSASVSVVVNPLPNPHISISGSQLSSNYNMGNAWYATGNSSILGTSQTYTPTQSDSFYVVEMDSLGCSASSNIIFFNPLGIGNLTGSSNNLVKIFSHDNNIYVLSENNIEEQLNIVIYNIIGQQILNSSFAPASKQVQQLNNVSLVAGNYIALVKSKEGITSVRVEVYK